MLAAKPAYRHLSPADFDLAYGLAKETTRVGGRIRSDLQAEQGGHIA